MLLLANLFILCCILFHLFFYFQKFVGYLLSVTTALAAPTPQLLSRAVVSHAVPTQLSTVRLVNEPVATQLSAVRLVDEPQAVAAVAAAGPAQYNYGYSVSDSLTGDAKTRQESRDGDVVTGSYSVLQPDGRLRTVTYSADKLHGFQADVKYDGAEGPVSIPVDAPGVAVDNSGIISVVREVTNPAASVISHIPQAVRTVQAVPAVVRQVPQAVHHVHDTPAVSVVRQVPQAVHVHDTPAVSVVRQVPATVQTVHNSPAVSVVRQVPQAVHHVHDAPAVSVVRQVPQAVHVHDSPAVSVVRQVPAVQGALTTGSSLQTLLGNSGLDLSQFRFISPVSLINN